MTALTAQTPISGETRNQSIESIPIPALIARLVRSENNSASGAESSELQSTSDSSQVDQNGQTLVGQRNAISILQELCAKNGLNLPSYSQVEQLGSCHEPTFWFNCQVVIGTEQIEGKASGRTKKAAKIASAEDVLRIIQEKQIPLYTTSTKV